MTTLLIGLLIFHGLLSRQQAVFVFIPLLVGGSDIGRCPLGAGAVLSPREDGSTIASVILSLFCLFSGYLQCFSFIYPLNFGRFFAFFALKSALFILKMPFSLAYIAKKLYLCSL